MFTKLPITAIANQSINNKLQIGHERKPTPAII
jgi:hypothetical protein